MHLLKTEIVQCFATEINMIYKYDFFFGVSHFCARIGQWVDGKLLNCKFIGFDCLRMPKVALLKSKKNIAHNVIIWHIQKTLFGMLIYKHITVRSHKQYKSIYK